MSENEILSIINQFQTNKDSEYNYEEIIGVFILLCKKFYYQQLNDTMKAIVQTDIDLNCRELLNLFDQFHNGRRFENIAKEIENYQLHFESVFC